MGAHGAPSRRSKLAETTWLERDLQEQGGALLFFLPTFGGIFYKDSIRPPWQRLAAGTNSLLSASPPKNQQAIRGGVMRYYVLIGIAMALSGSVDQAEAAIIYPWCAHYMMPNAPSNCGFATFEQCRSTVAGIGGTCQLNPFYAMSPPAAAPPTSRRWRARRS
jgi:hypothetical protein